MNSTGTHKIDPLGELPPRGSFVLLLPCFTVYCSADQNLLYSVSSKCKSHLSFTNKPFSSNILLLN